MIRKMLRGILNWTLKDKDTDMRMESNHALEYFSPKSIGIGSTAKSMYQNQTQSIETTGMNFVIFGAQGGKVVQVHQYDPATDRAKTTLYIVTDEDDLGEQLGMIVTREHLVR